MSKFKEVIFNISNNIVKYCFTLFCLLYAIGNVLFTYTINNSNYTEKGISFGLNPINIVLSIIFLVLLYAFVKNNFFNIKEKKLLCIFLAVSLFIGLFWIFTNDLVLRDEADALNCFNTAKSIYNNDLSVLKQGSYISVYPNNLGLVTYDLFHMKLFGVDGCLYSIRIVNLVFVLIGYYSIYAITDKLFNKNRTVNCLLILLMFGSMQFVFYSFFVYGNCVSYSLALSSISFFVGFLNDRKTKDLILSSITIVFAISIKMNSLIILIAELIYLLLDLLKNKHLIILLFAVISIVGLYFGTSGLQGYWGNKVEIDYSKTKLPTICWIAYGVNYDPSNPGHYTSQFEIFHSENGYYAEYTSIEAKNFIKNAIDRFIEKPIVGISYYAKKFLVSWANPQYEAFDQYRELHNSEFSQRVISGDINDGINYFWDSIANVVSIGLLSFIVLNFKKMKLEQMLPAVVVLGGFFFHALWEVKAVYLYQYYMYLLPYAAYGIYLLYKKVFNEKVI